MIDIVGTGGDGKGSFNISSLSALTVATCGLKVAKHGNRAVSSLAGSADFYESLGFNIQTSPEVTAQIITKTNFGFLYAPIYHSAMRHAAPVRKVMGVKTIMNLVGPLSNPVGASHQLIGVYADNLLEPVARAAHLLGVRHVMSVHSRDGFDELSPFAINDIVTVSLDGKVKRDIFDPSFLDLDPGEVEALSMVEMLIITQEMALDLLDGKGREGLIATVALNAGAALYVGGKAGSIREGYEIARKHLLDGSVKAKIDELRGITNGDDILVHICEKRERDYRRLTKTFGAAIPVQRRRPLVPFLSSPGAILEIKRSSPSKGLINADIDPVSRASSYRSSGAKQISILTERNFFGGSLDDLIAVGDAIDDVALLRKDFIQHDSDEIEVSYLAGADAVLLICAVLDTDTLQECADACAAYGLAPLTRSS